MQAAGRGISLAVLATGLAGVFAAPASAAFISSAELAELHWVDQLVTPVRSVSWEMSPAACVSERPLWWPEQPSEHFPRAILGKAPAVPAGQCGSPSQLIGSQVGSGQAAVSADNLEKDPILVSHLAIAERKLSRLPPIPLELLRPA